MLVVDSSVYIDWLRRRVELHRQLEPWIRADRVFGCGIIRTEVVRGVVDAGQRERIQQFFDLLPEYNLDADLWRAVADLAWKLDRKGHVLPLSDLAIAVCALNLRAHVITTDPSFKLVPGLKTRRDLPAFRSGI